VPLESKKYKSHFVPICFIPSSFIDNINDLSFHYLIRQFMHNKTSHLVYSTDVGRIKQPTTQKSVKTDGLVRIRRETKGRKGKGVTTVSGVNLAEAELKTLAKLLKQTCSTGGTVKDGVIEIQGDHRQILKTELEKRGHQVKLAGG
jgi:translation initiation factor 1|tara:strand:+ start:210 stop:647 length:438 start_codon:yes stop_codon:yes gene_type:complete